MNTTPEHNLSHWTIKHEDKGNIETVRPPKHKKDCGDSLEEKISSLATAMNDDSIVLYLLSNYSRMISHQMQENEVAGLLSQSSYITTLVKSITNRKR